MRDTTGMADTGFDVTLEQLDRYQFTVTFDATYEHPLITDESPPLGTNKGPTPARMLATAIGNCLAASLVFCLGRKGETLTQGVTARVHLELGRNEKNRLRVKQVDVTLRAPVGQDSPALLSCLDTFEDFCTVTQSVRSGFPVNVNVEAVG